jgi:integrase
MSRFARRLRISVERYIALQRALGYQFCKQASILRAFVAYVGMSRAAGPLTQAVAVAFAMSGDLAPNGRAKRYEVVRCFAQYHAAFDPRTESLDLRALPRSRAIAPPRILSDEELQLLMAASHRVSTDLPLRGQTLSTLIGLLASTGLRSGEALRLDRSDVDLTTGVLQIRQSKFRKDRLVPVHPTTLAALREYTRHRDLAFPASTDPAFFISTRGRRLRSGGLCYGFHQACALAGLILPVSKLLRPHDLRHRFAVTRLAAWHRQKADVQSLLPVLATYLGHARYCDTAYYITATPELLGLASKNAFGNRGVV